MQKYENHQTLKMWKRTKDNTVKTLKCENGQNIKMLKY